MGETIRGRIVKGISGFYYVYVVGSGLYECKAKGVFRNKGLKPLVGDYVEISVTDENNKLGNVDALLDRDNSLIRPAVANVDQALVIFAASNPEPNLNLLDRFLTMMEHQGLPVIIVLNKVDLCDEKRVDEIANIYENIGYQVIRTSVKQNQGVDKVREVLEGKTTTVAGPSGVGKSSLINGLHGTDIMETGAISEKIKRGKNTTRHSELIAIAESTFICDTPGFSTLYAPEIEAEDLRHLFDEFAEPSQGCRFLGCVHVNEPDCAVKAAVEAGEIAQSRYDNYLLMYEEIKNRKKY